MNLNQKIIKPKLGLLELEKVLEVYHLVVRLWVIAEIVTRFKELYETGGEEALYEMIW